MSETEQIDWGKVTQMQEALEEYTEEKLKRALVFDPKDIVRKAKQIREIYDEELGTIRYMCLSYDDLSKISEMKLNDREKSIEILARQLAPADPNVTVHGVKQLVADLKAMPYEVVVRLLVKLQGEGSFFYRKPAQAPKTLPNGSALALKPKTSV